MAKFQMLHGFVNVAGDRGMSVFRGTDSPMTFPEVLVLRAVHGGEEHVHELVDVGSEERDPVEEMSRLTRTYGDVAKQLFPSIGGFVQLPQGDQTIPTLEDKNAAEEAAAKIMEQRKAKRTAKADKSAAPAAAPAPAASLPAPEDL